MSQNVNTVNRSLHVSEDVVVDIIANAIMEVDGVAAVANAKKPPVGFTNLKKKNKPSRSIKVALAGDVLDISVGIILKNGAKAVATAENVQNKIKSAIQNMLNLTVTKVNVTVCDAAIGN